MHMKAGDFPRTNRVRNDFAMEAGQLHPKASNISASKSHAVTPHLTVGGGGGGAAGVASAVSAVASERFATPARRHASTTFMNAP